MIMRMDEIFKPQKLEDWPSKKVGPHINFPLFGMQLKMSQSSSAQHYLHSCLSPLRSQLPLPVRKKRGRVRGNTSIIHAVLKYMIKNGALNPVLKELLAVCVLPTQLIAIRHTMTRPRKNFLLVDKELGFFRTAVVRLTLSDGEYTLVLSSESVCAFISSAATMPVPVREYVQCTLYIRYKM